jgi:predicted O-linked N-acetylglucosamine transferase (SPINDLY family)
MNKLVTSDPAPLIESPAYSAMQAKNYPLAATLYEQAIQQDPDQRSNYWNLGLALLLQGQEAEAQMAWLMPLAASTPDTADTWTMELVQILQNEAESQSRSRSPESPNDALIWAIRCHIQELLPGDRANLCAMVELLAQMGSLTGEALAELQFVPALQQSPSVSSSVDSEQLLRVLTHVLAMSPQPITVECVVALLPHIENKAVLDQALMSGVLHLGQTYGCYGLVTQIIEQYLPMAPHRQEVLAQLAQMYQSAGDYDRGIAVAREGLELAPTLVSKLIANYLLLRGLMSSGGMWPAAIAALTEHEAMLNTLFQGHSKTMDSKTIDSEPIESEVMPPEDVLSLASVGFFLPYFDDNLPKHRGLQNQLMQVCQHQVRQVGAESIQQYQQAIATRRTQVHSTQRLKIGYLSHCLGRHSVGWLARWLLQHHDRDQFQIHGYFLQEFPNDGLHQWYLHQVDRACRMGVDCKRGTLALAEQIADDEIDILVDLDSATAYTTVDLFTLKPAPIQVTWLGWDAMGLDTIDYFLADPYVLPDTAQDHYVEKIWRLPQTYLAVDGFEVGVPSLRRQDLDIPSDAVIFLSAQSSYKRHPHTTQLQLEIIKQVPNSYFLIKGLGKEASIQAFFLDMAEQVGVPRDRLRFLPTVGSEEVHRANLAIADVVLDTFPYNGATTTMETLWMGIPLVTQVGQQFASRNSYTMLQNAGIEEGIAWNATEYVEWGVRLGRDAALRRRVAEKLGRSRQTAPLWNAKAFTRDVEAAYQQMWQIYLNGP